MPERLQLQRRGGWRMPANTIKVDRSTRWGNPFRVGPRYSAASAVADFRRWIENDGPKGLSEDLPAPPSLEDIRKHLAGRNLACWCAIGAPCHAEVLLTLANTGSNEDSARGQPALRSREPWASFWPWVA